MGKVVDMMPTLESRSFTKACYDGLERAVSVFMKTLISKEVTDCDISQFSRSEYEPKRKSTRLALMDALAVALKNKNQPSTSRVVVKNNYEYK